MKWLSADFKDLHALYVNQLRVMLDGEENIVRVLPDMQVAATDPQLQQIFESHYQETEVHIKRLEQILAEEKKRHPEVDRIEPVKCKAVSALRAEAEDMVMDARDAWVRDAALIAEAQRVDHYKIASYGTLRQYAQALGEVAAAELLDRTAREAIQADQFLTSIAERVNALAMAA